MNTNENWALFSTRSGIMTEHPNVSVSDRLRKIEHNCKGVGSREFNATLRLVQKNRAKRNQAGSFTRFLFISKAPVQKPQNTFSYIHSNQLRFWVDQVM